MKIYPDCLPCILKQVLVSSRMSNADENVTEEIMRQASFLLSNYTAFENTPVLVEKMHKIVKMLTGVKDPYKDIKNKDICAAKRLLPSLYRYYTENGSDLLSALKISAAGNVIDAAIYENMDIELCINDNMSSSFAICDIDILEQKLKSARNVLVIGDNAGETVFDIILLKHLFEYERYYSVRNSPVINDATYEDAVNSGLDEYAEIISSGCSAPGTVLSLCSQKFVELFESSNVVISKGQGNFEALSDCGRPIFFLLKAKCPMIAGKLKVKLNDFVFMYKSNFN